MGEEGTSFARGEEGTSFAPLPERRSPVRVRTLAIDLGTHVGWAAVLEDDRIEHGAVEFKRGRTGGARYLKFSRWLDGLHRRNPVAAVTYEDVRNHKGITAAHVYGGMEAILLAWAEIHGIPITAVGVGVWKKALGIKGNAGKPQVAAAIKRRGFAPATQDAADALGILLHHVERHSP